MMFDKLKKFWSSTSNLNGSNRTSPKPARYKSVRNVANIHYHEISRPVFCNEPKGTNNNRPPSELSNADSVSLDRYNIQCRLEDNHIQPTCEVMYRQDQQEHENSITPVAFENNPLVQITSPKPKYQHPAPYDKKSNTSLTSGNEGNDYHKCDVKVTPLPKDSEKTATLRLESSSVSSNKQRSTLSKITSLFRSPFAKQTPAVGRRLNKSFNTSSPPMISTGSGRVIKRSETVKYRLKPLLIDDFKLKESKSPNNGPMLKKVYNTYIPFDDANIPPLMDKRKSISAYSLLQTTSPEVRLKKTENSESKSTSDLRHASMKQQQIRMRSLSKSNFTSSDTPTRSDLSYVESNSFNYTPLPESHTRRRNDQEQAVAYASCSVNFNPNPSSMTQSLIIPKGGSRLNMDSQSDYRPYITQPYMIDTTTPKRIAPERRSSMYVNNKNTESPSSVDTSVGALYREDDDASTITEGFVQPMLHSPALRLRPNKSAHYLRQSASTSDAFARQDAYEREEDRPQYVTQRSSIHHQALRPTLLNLHQPPRSQSYVQLPGYINQAQNTTTYKPPRGYIQPTTFLDNKNHSSSQSSSGCVSNLSTTPSPNTNKNLENQIYNDMGNHHKASAPLPPPHLRTSLSTQFPPSDGTPPSRHQHLVNGSKAFYNSSRKTSQEVYIDEPPRGSLPSAVSDHRINQLEETLRDIQLQMNTSAQNNQINGIPLFSSTPITTPQKATDETQQTLLSLLMDKKSEADYLKQKLRKVQSKVEKQQAQFSEEIDKNHHEAEGIRNKLRQMNDRFNKLDDEYRLYKDSTDHIEHEKERALSACRRTEQEYENEINNLKDKLKGTKVSLEHLNQLNMDKTKVGNENAELSKQLKKKEAYIGQLKALLLLRSNSNEENGDENNEDCVGPLECNSKRKSVKGNKIGSLCSSTDKLSSRYSSSNSSGFGGSHSQEHLSSPTVGDRQINMTNSQTSTSSAGVDPIQTLPPRIQRMIRDSNEVGKKLRMLSKSIAEVSTNFVEGKDPEFHLLASRFSDSSESDEDYNETSATFTKTQFEHLLRKHQEDLSKAERFLGTLTGNVLHFTTRQATDHQQQPSCSIQ